jgi:hypothetical protein
VLCLRVRACVGTLGLVGWSAGAGAGAGAGGGGHGCCCCRFGAGYGALK